jgi:hypothetical protein
MAIEIYFQLIQIWATFLSVKVGKPLSSVKLGRNDHVMQWIAATIRNILILPPTVADDVNVYRTFVMHLIELEIKLFQ